MRVHGSLQENEYSEKCRGHFEPGTTCSPLAGEVTMGSLQPLLHSSRKNEHKILATTYSPLASTIGAGGLDFRVRNGIGYTPAAKSPVFYARFKNRF